MRDRNREPNTPPVHSPPGRELALSGQESRVLAFAMQGMIDKQIAETMAISVGTVRVYWRRIREKSGVTRSENIAGLARRQSRAEGERSASVYEAALRAMGVPFAVLDGRSGTVLHTERSFASLVGATEREVVGHCLRDWVPGLHEPLEAVYLPTSFAVCQDGALLSLVGDPGSIFVVWSAPGV